MRLGVARHGDTALMQRFGIEEVPSIAAQCGEDASTRQAYRGGDMTFGALRQWFLGLVHGAQAPLAGCLLEAAAMASEEEEEAEAAAVLEEPELPYTRLEYGAHGCPPGTEILSVQECELAVGMLGMDVEPRWVSMYPGIPKGCSVRVDVPEKGLERMHFNSAKEGQAREDLAPVCKIPQAPAPVKAPEPAAVAAEADPSAAARPPAASGKSQPVAEVLQLTRQNHREVFGREGFSLLYLSNGAITAPEAQMLVQLQKRFQPELHKLGTRLQWAWTDVRADRQLGQIFGARILPSAVILNPHKRPRFAPVKHEDKATMEGAIAALLNQLLGGDARFSSVPAKQLEA